MTQPEGSVVMPCLSKADTLGTCIEKAQRALLASDLVTQPTLESYGLSDADVIRIAHWEKRLFS